MEPDVLAWVRPAYGVRQGKYSGLQVMLFGLAALVFIAGAAVSLLALRTNHAAAVQIHTFSAKHPGAVSDGTAPPTETKPAPAAASTYTVPTDQPKQLLIPKIGVNALIKKLGVTAAGDLQAPTSIYDAGWYKDSAKPGSDAANGAMLIDGHIHGPTLPGVFAKLAKLTPGDKITVVRGDGKSFTYAVVKIQNYDAKTLDMGMTLTSIQPGKPGLNLITCGGSYDKLGHYDQRTVVFAVQV